MLSGFGGHGSAALKRSGDEAEKNFSLRSFPPMKLQ